MGRELTEPASIPLFAGLRGDEIASIMAAATRRTFKGSKVIIDPGEPADRLFLVTRGHVDYFVLAGHGKEMLMRRLVPGEVFGVASLLSEPMGYLGVAKPARESEVLEWQRRAVLQLARTYPRFPENAFRIALHYITLLAKRHARLASSTAAQRLASVMTDLASRAGRVLPSGVEIQIKNEELASLSDTTVFTASRVLKRWERERALAKRRGKVLILCPEKLIT